MSVPFIICVFYAYIVCTGNKPSKNTDDKRDAHFYPFLYIII